jgi:hypothetical protein
MTVTINTSKKVLEGKLIVTDETSTAKLKIVIYNENEGSVTVEFSKEDFEFLKEIVTEY